MIRETILKDLLKDQGNFSEELLGGAIQGAIDRISLDIFKYAMSNNSDTIGAPSDVVVASMSSAVEKSIIGDILRTDAINKLGDDAPLCKVLAEVTPDKAKALSDKIEEVEDKISSVLDCISEKYSDDVVLAALVGIANGKMLDNIIKKSKELIDEMSEEELKETFGVAFEMSNLGKCSKCDKCKR